MNLGLTRPPNPWRPGNVAPPPPPLGGWGGVAGSPAVRGFGGGGRGRGVFCCGRSRARVVTESLKPIRVEVMIKFTKRTILFNASV